MPKLFFVPLCALLCIPEVLPAQSPAYELYNLAVPGTPGFAPAAIVAADFNGDHKIDFAVATQGGNTPAPVLIYLSNGDGTFQQPASFVAGQFAYALASGDLNGDGKIDLVTGNAGSKDISVLLGNGDGSFQSAVSYPVNGAPGGLVVADLNGDGKLDIAVANQVPGSLSILLGHGDGTFSAASSQTFGTTLIGITAADFNGDGKLDLAIADSNTVWLLLGHGDGTFGSPQSIPVTGTLVGICAADFNGDKKSDLAVTDSDFPGGVYVLLGNGDGTFQAPLLLNTGRGAFAVAAGDFNGDGKFDLAVANNGEVPLQNDVSLLLGNGDGTFVAATPLGAGNNPVGLAAGDWNGDGKLDLAVANNGSSFVSLLFAGFPKAVSSFTTVSAADGSPALAAESLVSAYGLGISAFEQSAGLPVPTTLAGLTIAVQDSAGVSRLAPLLFTSLGQINFQIPAGTLAGPATLTILSGTDAAMAEQVSIDSVAPALFSADNTGKGVAAATAFSVSGSNPAETPVPVFQCDPVSGCSAIPIVLSAGQQVYVSLFGTGIRGAGGASDVTCTINGTSVPVQYAGAQPVYLGLDQVNVTLPISLRGSGPSEVVLSTRGHLSNTVMLDIQ